MRGFFHASDSFIVREIFVGRALVDSRVGLPALFPSRRFARTNFQPFRHDGAQGVVQLNVVLVQCLPIASARGVETARWGQYAKFRVTVDEAVLIDGRAVGQFYSQVHIQSLP